MIASWEAPGLEGCIELCGVLDLCDELAGVFYVFGAMLGWVQESAETLDAGGALLNGTEAGRGKAAVVWVLYFGQRKGHMARPAPINAARYEHCADGVGGALLE